MLDFSPTENGRSPLILKMVGFQLFLEVARYIIYYSFIWERKMTFVNNTPMQL